MRVILGFILFISSTFALSTAKFAQDLTEKLLDATKTDTILTSQCSQFVKSCLDLCEGAGISNFSTTCSARNATCECNDVDHSASVFTTMLQYSIQGIVKDKKKLEVEPNRTITHVSSVKQPVQYNNLLVLSEGKQQQQQDKRDVGIAEENQEEATVAEAAVEQGYELKAAAAIEQEEHIEEAEEIVEDMYIPPILRQQPPLAPSNVLEFIYPQSQIIISVPFQQSYCGEYQLRCKQDCPAAFSSTSCNVNTDTTGFLLLCVCNGVDITSSVLAQVQAESKGKSWIY